MKRLKQVLSSICLLALVSGAPLGAAGQERERRQPPPDEHAPMRVVFAGQQPPGAPAQGVVLAKQPGDDGFYMNFLSSEMSFEGRVVKGAPYAAEAVSESVQTLADGNRIVRRSSALIYRDAEGRTRREQTMDNVGPFATAGDAPRLVFINDPVGEANYVLDARTHTARKATMYAYNFRTGGDRPEPPPPMGPPMGPPPMGERGEGPPKPPPPGALRHEATTRVQPVYPPVARAAGAQGIVSVQVTIDEQGNVVSARAVSGHPLLHQASVDAARQWVFKPAIINGKPAKVSGMISFSFVLEEKEIVNGEARPKASIDGDARPAPPPPPPPKFPVHEESLGQQTLEGVQATGTRATVTIPAGAIGNEREIKVVTERWYSPELQTVVLTKHSDPRFGETTYRLTNINRSEPAHSLFEVPADYTIKEGGPEKREFRFERRPNNEQ